MDLFKCRSDPDSDSSLELDVHATLGVCIAAMNQEGEKGAPAIPGRKWRLLAKERDRTPVVEIENKGVFDELVVDQWLHIEQMSRSVWWMRLGDASINIRVKRDSSVELTLNQAPFVDGPRPV